MQRIHPQRIKNAKNYPSKGEKCKEFTLKQCKLQRIHSQRVEKTKNSFPEGKKCREFTLET